jgi:hypothetical protein
VRAPYGFLEEQTQARLAFAASIKGALIFPTLTRTLHRMLHQVLVLDGGAAPTTSSWQARYRRSMRLVRDEFIH